MSKHTRKTAPIPTLLEEGREHRLILDNGAHVSFYSGDTLETVLARATREHPDARTAVLQAWWNKNWTYGEQALELPTNDTEAIAETGPDNNL